jgi:hypothetical protein
MDMLKFQSPRFHFRNIFFLCLYMIYLFHAPVWWTHSFTEITVPLFIYTNVILKNIFYSHALQSWLPLQRGEHSLMNSTLLVHTSPVFLETSCLLYTLQSVHHCVLVTFHNTECCFPFSSAFSNLKFTRLPKVKTTFFTSFAVRCHLTRTSQWYMRKSNMGTFEMSLKG